MNPRDSMAATLSIFQVLYRLTISWIVN